MIRIQLLNEVDYENRKLIKFFNDLHGGELLLGRYPYIYFIEDLFKFRGSSNRFIDYPSFARYVFLSNSIIFINDKNTYISRSYMDLVMEDIEEDLVKDYMETCYLLSLNIAKEKRMLKYKEKCILCNTQCDIQSKIKKHVITKKHTKKLLYLVDNFTDYKFCKNIINKIYSYMSDYY